MKYSATLKYASRTLCKEVWRSGYKFDSAADGAGGASTAAAYTVAAAETEALNEAPEKLFVK